MFDICCVRPSVTFMVVDTSVVIFTCGNDTGAPTGALLNVSLFGLFGCSAVNIRGITLVLHSL